MHDTDTFKKDIQQYYDVEEELGSGQFAVVRKLVEKETEDEYAGKYVRKKRTKASRNGMSREDILREIEILRMVDSEKIIKVHDVYETDREMILVMELLRGGELFDYISKKDFLTEEEAIDFTRQILQALQHLHSRNIVHLDLKPENILLKNTRRKTIKLVDFGLARVVKENEQVREIMGTPEFVAPEVLNFDTISTATDMWALGVIAYILLSGASPFLGEDNQETFTNIIQVDYQFDEEYFSEISDEAKDFIRKLLVRNPRKRPSAHECSRHTWVEENVVDKKKKQRRRTTQICTFNFKRFVARKRWKMSYNKIRAMNLIAKMGIKPPPGFITEIPPMMENDVSLVNDKNEDGKEENEDHTEHKDNKEHRDHHKDHRDHHKDHRDHHKEHKEHHKKNASTINRRKHKQNSSPKQPVEKANSLTLKTMDIDIGEGGDVDSGTEHVTSDHERMDVVEPSPSVGEPRDYGSMTKREKRRARGQLRHDEIVMSKEIEAKKSKSEDEEERIAVQDNEPAMTEPEDVPAPELEPESEASTAKKTVTSTMHIEQKPSGKTGGILKKRDSKSTRIPSTEDHYLVTLSSALFQPKEAPLEAEKVKEKPYPQHGILKHALPKTSQDPVDTSNSERSKDEESNQGVMSGFNVQVEVAGSQVLPTGDDSPVEDSNSAQPCPGSEIEMTRDEVFESETEAVVKNTVREEDVAPKTDHKGSALVRKESNEHNSQGRMNKNGPIFSPQKKSFSKNDDTSQQRQKRFTPLSWQTQQKSSNDNLKSSPKSLPGVTKVSLKANRFVSNDKSSSPKSPTSPSGHKTSNVLGKSKLFQKENVPAKNSENLKKAAATKTNSLTEELKSVSREIALEEPKKAAKESAERKVSTERKVDAQRRISSEKLVLNKGAKEKELKRRDSREAKGDGVDLTKRRSGSVRDIINNNSNNMKANKGVASGNRSRSSSARSTKKSAVDEKIARADLRESVGKTSVPDVGSRVVLNGESTRPGSQQPPPEEVENGSKALYESTVQISVEQEEIKEEIRSSSTHNLTEFTIRPRQNSGDEKRGGFDVMLTIGPQEQPITQDARVSSIKSRFTSSSSSSLIDSKAGVPNGKLTSVSAVDVTSHSRETSHATMTIIDRNGAAPGSKSGYTPQRDFSKYLTADQPIKVTAKASESSPRNAKTPARQHAVHVTRPSQTTPLTPVSKGKKQAVSTTVYVPRRTFGFSPKPGNQTETDDTPKIDNNDQSKRWSNSSIASDRSASSASSDGSAVDTVGVEHQSDSGAGNLDSTKQHSGNGNSKNFNTSRKIEDYSSGSPQGSPVLERKWKATLVLPKENERAPTTKDRDFRISSSNAPRKKNFTNVKSMWEGK